MARCIYLDMDGVFVDFVRGVHTFYGKLLPDDKYDRIQWNFDKDFFPGVPEAEGRQRFWSQLGFNFWATLPWTPWGRDLVNTLVAAVGVENIVIVTSPCKTQGSIEGKLAWIERELPDFARDVAVCPAKHKLASPEKMLVDDSLDNLHKFQKAGGHTHTVNAPWNFVNYKTGVNEPVPVLIANAAQNFLYGSKTQ